MRNIRNFSIIAHVDHGKSTLADCFIRTCKGLSEREMVDQVLDSMDLERERGITIKAQSATLAYAAKSGGEYMLNLIDTPGHADFSYEVSRSLSACEGALLVVDAAQGVQAQTLANCYKAVELGLEIIPVVNKVDLPSADVERVAAQIRDIVGLSTEDLLTCSAKTGQGVGDILEAIVERVEPPTGDPDAPLQALVMDSWFDPYSGVVILARIVNGELKEGSKIKFMSSGTERLVGESGKFTPRSQRCKSLRCGEVGYIIAGIKDLEAAKVGDTITDSKRPADGSLAGFHQVRPQMYASFFPLEANLFNQLRDSLERLKLNDSSLTLEPENSKAFGHGIRCGFLGLLHMEIVQERLEREYKVESLITAPNVVHELELTDGSVKTIHTPSDLPSRESIRALREPVAKVTVVSPHEHLGSVMQLCIAHRGRQLGLEQAGSRTVSYWSMPVAELITGFTGELKSATQGYASHDYEPSGFDEADIVRVDILVNEDKIDALTMLIPREQVEKRSRDILNRLKDVIPRQHFQVPLQAVIGGKIIARENIKALRKNVLAKCYGGDVTRKKKLIERQKRGKRRMKKFGKVEIPQDAFLAVMQKDAANG